MASDAETTVKSLVPKFKFDGGNPTTFIREFIPVVAKAYGIAAVYEWAEDKALDDEEERLDNLAGLVLRQYLSDRVLKIVTVGQPKRTSSVYKVLKTIYLTSDLRTSVQVNMELTACQMAIGESLTDFVARINALVEECQQLGDVISEKQRMVILATRLREPWRKLANDHIDRDRDLKALE